MNGNRDMTYPLDFRVGKRGQKENTVSSLKAEVAWPVIPRIARLMALAIRFEGMLQEETIQDYAQLARLGRVTRARMTQIMKLLDLAPDIQEQILFLAVYFLLWRLCSGVFRLEFSLPFMTPS